MKNMRKIHFLLIIILFSTVIVKSQNLGNLPGNPNTGNNPINPNINVQQSINYNPQVQVNNLNKININDNNVNNDQQYLAVNQTVQNDGVDLNKVQINLPQLSSNRSSRRSSSSVSSFVAGEKKHSMHLNLKIKASPQMKRFFNEKFIFSKDKKKKRHVRSKNKFRRCPKF